VLRRVKPIIRCVIFDLDDTLYDCLGQRVRVTHRYAAQAMVEAGLKADAEAVYRARIRAFRTDLCCVTSMLKLPAISVPKI